MAELKLENIYPTLFIGLGGAGGHVISRLSRLFERDFGEQIRALDASPLQFLLLDTDDFEKLPQEVRNNLGDRERNFLSLSHFNPRRYAEGQLAFKDSDLHRWFDPRVLPFLEDAIIHDGASRLRMLGRLCLHYRYHDVEQRIRQKFEQAMDAKVHAAAQRIKPEPRPFRVFIVASSCGGTGSALFVDIACLANRIVRDRGTTPDVQGFVFLPFPFIEANAQIDPALEGFYQHNAWAFFEELNHLLRNPEQLPSIALDPARGYGEPPRPFEYGRDLLRTIYLVGHHIPPLGTLDLGDPLYSYVANGIYHVFLTPEEGRVQSSYSNIKTKLQEPDRSFRYIKRFATFGYAEYRLAPQRYADGVARHLVERERRALLGEEPTEHAATRAADELLHEVERLLAAERDIARAWAPQLPTAGGVVTEEAGEEIARAIEGVPLLAARGLEQKRDELDERAAVAALSGRIRSLLGQRLRDVPVGLRLEQRVLERFQYRLEQLADRLTGPAAEAPLEADASVMDRVRRMAAEANALDRRALGVGAPRRDRGRARSLESNVAALLALVTEGARRRLIVEQERKLGLALRELAQSAWLAEHRAAVGRALAALDQPLRWAEDQSLRESPTIQQIPTDGMLQQAELTARADELYRVHAAAVEPRRRALWELLQARIQEPAALREFYEVLYREWSRFAAEGLPSSEELLRRWDEWRAREEPGGLVGGAPSRDGALKRLMPLSTPACPVDFDRMHKQDTAALITVGVGRFDDFDDARSRLGASGPFDLIVNDGERFAVLQTRYAFSSRAIEGMETLRRSYLDRDPATSFPHVHTEWNERGLEDADSLAVPFSPAECRHIARALALHDLMTNGGNGGGPVPGLRIRRDEHDREAFFLLRHSRDDGWPSLRWRDLRPVEGFTQTWQPAEHAASAARAGNGDARDLIHELAHYLGSPARQHHAEFLQELSRVERAEPHRARYLQAYRSYRERLHSRIEEERKRARVRYVPLLEALARALDEHIAEFDDRETLML